MNEWDLMVNRLIAGLDCGLLIAKHYSYGYELTSPYFCDCVDVFIEKGFVRFRGARSVIGSKRMAKLVSAIETSLDK